MVKKLLVILFCSMLIFSSCQNASSILGNKTNGSNSSENAKFWKLIKSESYNYGTGGYNLSGTNYYYDHKYYTPDNYFAKYRFESNVSSLSTGYFERKNSVYKSTSSSKSNEGTENEILQTNDTVATYDENGFEKTYTTKSSSYYKSTNTTTESTTTQTYEYKLEDISNGRKTYKCKHTFRTVSGSYDNTSYSYSRRIVDLNNKDLERINYSDEYVTPISKTVYSYLVENPAKAIVTKTEYLSDTYEYYNTNHTMLELTGEKCTYQTDITYKLKNSDTVYKSRTITYLELSEYEGI